MLCYTFLSILPMLCYTFFFHISHALLYAFSRISHALLYVFFSYFPCFVIRFFSVFPMLCYTLVPAVKQHLNSCKKNPLSQIPSHRYTAFPVSLLRTVDGVYICYTCPQLRSPVVTSLSLAHALGAAQHKRLKGVCLRV